jgi:formylglycine-generating enzyme required for sulfatase activity
MSAPPRKTGLGPLVAITLLVALLTAFLVVRLRKSDEVDPVVKAPPPPPPPVAVAPPPPPPPPEPTSAPERKELDALIEAASKAVEEKRWKDAEEAIGKAAAIAAEAAKPLREKLDAGRKAEEEAKRAAEAREALRKRDEAFSAARTEIEKLVGESRWDAATAVLEKLARDFPGIERDEPYRVEAKKIADYRRDCDAVFVQWMTEAEKLFREGKHAQAATVAEKSILNYPERRPKVTEFHQRVRQAKIDAEMLRIPSALCWIGSELSPDEKPHRQVKLPAFYIDRTEVSNEDYQNFVLATGRPAPLHWGGKGPPKGRERHPVVMVTWEDARAYAEWAGKRLPTAEEWEVAARGPDDREYPWGSVFTEKENVFHANSVEFWQYQRALGSTVPVDAVQGANGESAFRVQGMGGNVWEWTATAGRKGEGGPEYRILKGGSFMTSAKALRCANVLLEDPRLPHPDVGFRCVRDAK